MGCGVRLLNVTNGAVEGCVLTNNLCGISVENSSGIVIRGNSVSEGDAPNVETGIRISNSFDIELSGNALERNGLTIDGSVLEHFNMHSISESNTVNGLPIVFVKDAANHEVSGGDIGQLIAVNCTDLVITGVSINNTDVGATLAFCQDFDISLSSFSDCLFANVQILHSSGGVLYRCDISGSLSENGLKIQDSQSIRVEQCRLWDNEWDSIDVEMCDEVAVESNHVWGATTGLYVRDSQNVTMKRNSISTKGVSGCFVNCNYSTITENTVASEYAGLSFSYSSSNATVAYNTVFACQLAVQLWESVDFLTFHHNNFINNTEEVKCIGNVSVVWNLPYPEGGNYWSNHSNDDHAFGENQDIFGQDGIADVPYAPAENNTDAYPLIAPAGSHALVPIPSIEVEWGHIYTNGYFTVTAAESWDFTDSLDELEIRWDWGNDGTWDTDWSADMSTEHVLRADDNANVRVQVMDSEGNVGELFTDVPFDPDPPYAAVMADAKPKLTNPESYEGESVIIQWGMLDTGTGIDGDSVTWMLDGDNIEHGGFSYSAIWVGGQYEVGGYITFFGLSSGSHTFKVLGNDFSGNAVESEITFVVLPTFLQTREGVAATSLGIAACAGAVAVVILYMVEERRIRKLQRKSSEEENKPQADDGQRPLP
ncbi:MAG: right-handed parallel beta-helix repeat-containing protein [Thermoplasmata archaeon]|jgi:parallel beta-helix repeat protein|nr:right-handed parallel beta-helix repeat-containing protein [Thermoplasmata archaeon]